MQDGAAKHRGEPSAEDLRIAGEVLSQLKPLLAADTPEYRDKLHALARFRAEIGEDPFDLRYGRRPPRNAAEQVEVDFFAGRITEDELKSALKADAERPIDATMLDAFCRAYEGRLQAYGRMLQTVIAIATDEREPDTWLQREPEVDRHVEAMKAKLPLWNEQVATVFSFLAELRAERSGEPVRCGDRSAESAHGLANMVMGQAAEGWQSCKEIAARSRTDPSYRRAASASQLFHEAHLPGLPRANDLRPLMVLERARARKAVQEQDRTAHASPPAPANIQIQTEAVNVTAQGVSSGGTKAEDGGKPSRKPRLKREAVEPKILEHLVRRPHDTAEEISKAVGCSIGVVAESRAWKANQLRLRIAAKEGRDPKAVRLSPQVTTAAGVDIETQRHAWEEDEATLDEKIDSRQQALAEKIGEYLKKHPDARPQAVAQAVGCTAGEVERRQIVLNRLMAQQAESAEEDEGGKYSPEKRKRRPGDLPPRQVPRRV